MDFEAPNVATATTLNFTLTVVDASNTSASAHVMVKVAPASDPNQFLTAPVSNPAGRAFQVVVVPQATLPPQTTDTPICLSLDRTINYTARGTNGAGAQETLTLPRRPTDQIDTAWVAAAGGVGAQAAGSLATAAASYTNPRATFYVTASQ